MTRTAMATRRTIDFDAFRAEQKNEPVYLTLGGKDIELPPSLPAALALDMARLGALDDDADVDPAEIVRIGKAIFGSEEAFRALLETHGVTMAELPELVRMVIEAYTTSPSADPSPDAQE